MPDSATGQASLRAMLAGLGTAGMLVGAVAAVAALTAGVVAFNTWPGSPGGGDRSAVPLGGSARDAARAVTAASAAANASATATSASTAAAQRRASAATRTRTGGASGPVQDSATRTRLGAGPAATASGGVVASTSQPSTTSAGPSGERRRIVADLADQTGRQIAGGVKDGAAVVSGATRPVNASAADVVGKLSDDVATAVAAAAESVSDVLRRLPTRPPPPG